MSRHRSDSPHPGISGFTSGSDITFYNISSTVYVAFTTESDNVYLYELVSAAGKFQHVQV